MRKSQEYFKEINDALRGQALRDKGVPPERVDWGGTSVVLDLFDSATSAPERGEFVQALAKIIDESPEAPVVAQVIHIASSLDILDVQPNVAKVRGRKEVGADPAVVAAVNNYEVFRNLRTHKK